MGSHHSLFSTRNHLDPSLVRLYGRSAFPPSLNFSFLLIPLGHCLVTLGTGPRPHLHWRTTPLLTAHSYPVIGLSLPLTPPSYSQFQTSSRATTTNVSSPCSIPPCRINPPVPSIFPGQTLSIFSTVSTSAGIPPCGLIVSIFTGKYHPFSLSLSLIPPN